MIPLFALVSQTSSLEAGAKAAGEFRVEDAVTLLERARTEGPYAHADHVRLYEQLGIALAYAGRIEEAIDAFDHMLGLDPSHALSYTLSPKATLVFEQARERARGRPAPAIDLGLPRGKTVGDPLPIDLDILADPHRTLARAVLYHRTHDVLRERTIPLVDPSGRHRIVLDPIGEAREAVISVHVVVLDQRGNEVLLIGSRDHPREIGVGYTPPTPWYGQWWVWTIASAVVVAGTTTAAILATRSEDPTIPVNVRRQE